MQAGNREKGSMARAHLAPPSVSLVPPAGAGVTNRGPQARFLPPAPVARGSVGDAPMAVRIVPPPLLGAPLGSSPEIQDDEDDVKLPWSPGEDMAPKRPKPGPFGSGTRMYVCVHGSCKALGASALLADLEDLAKPFGVQVASRPCLGACGQGPNCLLEPPAGSENSRSTRGRSRRSHVERGITTFDKTLQLLAIAGDCSENTIDHHLQKRSRLRSDALRILCRDAGNRPTNVVADELVEAFDLLSEALGCELDRTSVGGSVSSNRVRELRLLRGRTRGRLALTDRSNCSAHADIAAKDFQDIIALEPQCVGAYIELARVYSFIGRIPEALDFYRQAFNMSTSAESLVPKAFRLKRDEISHLQRSIEKMEARIAAGPAGMLSAEGSDGFSDGRGQWKVSEITGLSWDTCVYHLEREPPSEPHPFPHDAWHVQVQFGGEAREYTPVSSAAEWERGKLDLVVKTYPHGKVSKEFAKLRTFEEGQRASQSQYSPIEDQPCWVFVTSPQITLYLPSLTETLDDAERGDADAGAIEFLGIVVGGTGFAPGLQLLREVANLDGPFSSTCQATMLYSSRTEIDVLMLDELRSVQSSSPSRITVRHTLTDVEEGVDPWDKIPPQQHFPGRHHHFVSYFKPFEPTSGPLDIGGPEACLRGRIDSHMLTSVLPKPALRRRVVLCGPQSMMDDVTNMLMKLGYSDADIIELRASSHQSEDAALPKVVASASPRSPELSTVPQRKPDQDAPVVGRATMGSFADRVKAMQ